jgi:hypothetical protein
LLSEKLIYCTFLLSIVPSLLSRAFQPLLVSLFIRRVRWEYTFRNCGSWCARCSYLGWLVNGKGDVLNDIWKEKTKNALRKTSLSVTWSTKIPIWTPLIEVEPPILFNVSRYRKVKEKTEDIWGNLRKKKNWSFEKNCGRGSLDKIKTDFGAVDNERTGWFAVDQDMGLPDRLVRGVCWWENVCILSNDPNFDSSQTSKRDESIGEFQVSDS